MERYGQELNPILAEALLQLLKEYAHNVDQTADLPDGIDGITEYYWDPKPTAKIDARLTSGGEAPSGHMSPTSVSGEVGLAWIPRRRVLVGQSQSIRM